MEAQRRRIQPERLPVCAIVCQHPHRAMHADQELMAAPVRVFAARLLRGHVVDHEMAPRHERQIAFELAHGERTADVDEVRQAKQADTRHTGFVGADGLGERGLSLIHI